MREYQVWSEGYQCTGQASGATYHGTYKAESFTEAILECFKDKQPEYLNKEKTAYWGCRLFDNEKEAREAFG